MKVNNSTNQALANVQSSKTKKLEKNLLGQTEDSKTASAAELKESANVQLSSKAQEFQKAKAIASDDSIDEAKVARLQKMIDAGEYKIDAESIADRLVDEHLLMG